MRFLQRSTLSNNRHNRHGNDIAGTKTDTITAQMTLNHRTRLQWLSLLGLMATPLSFATSLHETTSTPQPSTLLPEFTATYEAKYGGISVTATRSLTALDYNEYEFRFSVDSFFVDRTETTRFRWKKTQVSPISYQYLREGWGRDRQATLNFDWEKNTVLNNVQGQPWKMEIPPGTLDKLSYQLQVRRDLLDLQTSDKQALNERIHQPSPATEPQSGAGTDATDTLWQIGPYLIADGGILKHYQFQWLGQEVINTKLGQFRATKIRRIRSNDPKHHETLLWLADEWAYLLLRLQHHDEDQSYEINISTAAIDGIPVKGH
ncbi:DUF3108 domain-containing protein [Marinibactrum halimedae]|uniref:DUF3108 domain-containing protein n=1 Tax=Marinibactrum halimedae TaxID=1444977 RepID=A0AA37T7R4_9GAMM|nr:DUF3108 domain-containing protein [Marinibactrum halimedae]MCD9457481.1 DUF3108 domain-containing protein [Marinibactrum halimedae]GLS25466.1 hypothetical protein GCM10007877_11800 [Marinibactrum halimedae]